MFEQRRWHGPVLALAALLAIGSGCSQTAFDQATGKGWIRGINSIVDSPELVYVIAEQAEGGISFRETVGFNEWDDLTYNFSFDLFRQGAEEPDRLATQPIDVQPDIEYSLALIGSLDDPSILMWEVPERDWSGSESVFEADFVHLSPLSGQVDVYYAPAGTAPADGNQVGTLSYGERLPYREFEEGDYVLIITAPGDPSTIILQSDAVLRGPAERVTIALFDPDLTITSPLGVNIIDRNGNATPLPDINALPTARMLHAAFDTGPFDGYINDDFTAPAFPAVAFGAVSPYVDMADDEVPLTITPAGEPGTTLLEDTIVSIDNTQQTVVFFGTPDAWQVRALLDNSRPIATEPQFRIANLSVNVESVDIWDIEVGTSLEDAVLPRFFNVPSGSSTSFSFAFLEPRDLVVTRTGETEPISAPLTLDLAPGTITDLMIVDTADPAVVELRIFDTRP
jgi:hypothetical protein